jgi:hypothetical protein
MLEMLCIFSRLLLLMISLIIIGEPIRVVFSKYFHFFKELDFLQISVLNVYLGGLALYLIAIFPLRFFNVNVVWAIIVMSGVLFIILHKEGLKKVKSLTRGSQECVISLRNYLFENKIAVLQCSAVFGMFLAGLWIQVVPLSSFIFGSIHDTSLHSLFVQVMLENQGVPVTMQPYLSEGILYPQAAHVFFAYACLIFGYIPPEAIFHVTTLFQALTILSVYYLGKACSSRRLGVSLAFIFFCISRWPRLLTWGVNPYIIAFPIQFISLSFIPFLRGSGRENNIRDRVSSLLVIGVLLGYLAALHLTLYIIAMATFTVLIFIDMLRKHTLYGLRNLLIALGASLIPISLFIYRFVELYSYPGYNIGLPSDIIIAPAQYVNMLAWLFLSDGISPYPPLVAIIIGLLIVSCIGLYRKRGQLDGLLNSVQLSLCLLIASLSLFLLFHLQYLLPQLSLVMGEAVRPTVSMYISWCFLIGIFNVILCDTLINNLRKRLARIVLPREHVLTNTIATVLALLVLSCIYSPFMYYTITHDTGYLVEGYGKFSVTTFDDYNLMLWMRDNLPKKSIILVNMYEPGMFIPSISHRKAIYPFSLSQESHYYQQLIGAIQNGTMDSTMYDAMMQLNITYVYVGAQSGYRWDKNLKWDPQVFLSNPNFDITKKIGNAYLFEVLYEKPEVVLRDSFEYGDISDMGWKFGIAEGHLYSGSGYVSTNSSYAYDGNRSLVIAAKNEGGLLYANWIYRKIYVWDTSNITLSFYINASAGFSSPDELSICVYDTSWNRSICFVTPNCLRAESDSTIILQNSVDFLSFNISEIWQETHNSTLPTTFFIRIQNIDFDGVENVGYVDNIVVRVSD